MYKEDKKQIEQILNKNGINKLYHFTDRSNLYSILTNGGLFSWEKCNKMGILISRSGGDELSRNLDSKSRLSNYVRVSFCEKHPMKYKALSEHRISDPIIIEISPEICYLKDTKFSDKNATDKNAKVGETVDYLPKDFLIFRSVYYHYHKINKRNTKQKSW